MMMMMMTRSLIDTSTQMIRFGADAIFKKEVWTVALVVSVGRR